jgi:hypothetical protein
MQHRLLQDCKSTGADRPVQTPVAHRPGRGYAFDRLIWGTLRWQTIRDMGRMAAEKLLAPIRGVHPAGLDQPEVRPSLVVRNSDIAAVAD